MFTEHTKLGYVTLPGETDHDLGVLEIGYDPVLFELPSRTEISMFSYAIMMPERCRNGHDTLRNNGI